MLLLPGKILFRVYQARAAMVLHLAGHGCCRSSFERCAAVVGLSESLNGALFENLHQIYRITFCYILL